MRFGGPVLLLNPVLALVLNLVKPGAAAPVLNLVLVLPLNLPLALLKTAAKSTPLPPGL
jgi:hypothetical protein